MSKVKILAIISIIALILPNLTEAEKYRAKGWIYGGLINGGVGLGQMYYDKHPERIHATYFLGVPRLSIGLPPPYGFGIGTEWAEAFLELEEVTSEDFPIYICYVPFANWDRLGHPRPIVYADCAIGPYNEYLRFGIGIDWQLWYVFALGFRADYFSRPGYHLARKGFYVGINLGLSLWQGLGVRIKEKKTPPKPEVVAEIPKITSPLPITQPPKLTFDYSLIDENQDKILDGGEKITLKVTVKNQGEGDAQGVKVLLSGSSKVIKYFGNEKYLGDIPAGSEKEAVFEAILPYRIEPDNANLIIKVTEANGFDALKEAELLIAMQPAKVEREREVVSVLVDVDQPLSPTSFRREDAYAVIIGITTYRSNKIPKVKYAKRDAEIMKDYLINVCGIPEENFVSLTDEKATLSDLIAYIEEWLQRNVNKNSFVFVYFAGHGTPNPEKGDAYLVPYDGEPGFISKLYPLSRFYNSLENLPTENIVVALDACFSGAGGRSVIEEGKRPLISPKIEKVGKKAVVITASGSDEISQDLDTQRHGLFTYYILKGLRGEADFNGDGWITLGELYNYCQPRVKEESRRLGYTQTPKVFPEPLGEKANLRIGKVR